MKKYRYQEEVVWVIGASSGIGEALVKALALEGAVLALSARREERLGLLRDTLGSQHKIFELDVADAALVERTAKAVHAAFGRIDRVIFLAASYTPQQLDAMDMQAVEEMVRVNLLGALHVVHAVLPLLKNQGYGQIALCASVAGYIGLPGGQPYSATKAGVINVAESLYAEQQGTMDVKLINPGFVRTALTDKNDFDMPMILSPEKAAQCILKGLMRSGFEIHFPKRFTCWLKLLRILPYRLTFAITKRLKL